MTKEEKQKRAENKKVEKRCIAYCSVKNALTNLNKGNILTYKEVQILAIVKVNPKGYDIEGVIKILFGK